MKEEKIFKSGEKGIVVRKVDYDILVKKYPGAIGTITKEINYWCEKYNKKPFEEETKKIWIKEIADWLGNNGHQKFIDDLLDVGVKVKDYHSPVKVNKLKDQSFIVTGSLENLTREDAHKKIIQYEAPPKK